MFNVNYILIPVTLFLFTERFFVPHHKLDLPGAYQAVAHLWVGGLIGAFAVSKKKSYLMLVLLLIGVEGYMTIRNFM